MRDAKWIIAIFAAIAFAGGVAVVAAITIGEYGVSRTKQLSAEEKTDADKAVAKKYALQALRHHGIRSLAKECNAEYEDGYWKVSGQAINEHGSISEVTVFFRVATVGRKTRWELVSGEVDGAGFQR